MSVLEIVLLIMGIVIFIGSFLIPEGKTRSGRDEAAMDEKKIHDLVEKEVEEAQGRITDIVDETITYAMEKTERSMDRLTNEKMMAVNEYSDTVLSEINKNHQEVVFLYDMLNDKHENLKNTVTEVERTAKEVRQTVKDAEINARERTVKEGAPETASVEVQTTQQEVPQQTGFELFGVSGAFVPEKVAIAETKKTPKKSAGAAKARTRAVLDTDRESTSKGQENEEKGVAENGVKGTTEEPAEKPAEKPAARKRTAKPKTEAEVPSVAVSLDKAGRSGTRNSNEKILELHKAGKSNMAIAKELGLGIGEVKLVIDLFEGM